MRDKKLYIVIITILVIFFVVMFLVFGVENINQKSYSSTIILGDDTVWIYENMRWINVESIVSKQKLSWREYNVYVDNKSIGKYLLWFDNKWYVFDKNKNAIDIDGNLLAFNSNFNMKVFDYHEEKVEDSSYLYQVLQENDLSISSQYTSLSRINFDFDSDGKNEDFYLISNAFPMDFNPEMIFSLVFMVKDDNIYYLYRDVSNNTGFNGCKPFWNTILDTNNDGKYEIVLSCSRYSVSEQIDMLYGFDNNEFKILISN